MVSSCSARRLTPEQTFPDAADEKVAAPGII